MKMSARARCASSSATAASASSSRGGTPANTGFPARKAAISLADIGGRIARGCCGEPTPGCGPRASRGRAWDHLTERILDGLSVAPRMQKNTARRAKAMRGLAELVLLGVLATTPAQAEATQPVIDAPTVLERSPAAIQASLGRPVRTQAVPRGDFRMPEGGTARVYAAPGTRIDVDFEQERATTVV